MGVSAAKECVRAPTVAMTSGNRQAIEVDPPQIDVTEIVAGLRSGRPWPPVGPAEWATEPIAIVAGTGRGSQRCGRASQGADSGRRSTDNSRGDVGSV